MWRTLARALLRFDFQSALAENLDQLVRGDFTTLGALMDRFGFGCWNIALVLEAPDNARSIAGFFGCGTGVFLCLTHKRPILCPQPLWVAV
jgi:hypothetical protein